MKTTDDRELEGRDRARMNPTWGIHARIEPKHEQPGMRTLTLGVSDGPECYVDFDPARGIANIGHGEHDRDDDDSEGSLLHAISEAATAMAEAAVIDEASAWIREHEETYLIVGESGEHDDRRTWNVRAFLNRDRAEACAAGLNSWMGERGFGRPDGVGMYKAAMAAKAECPDRRWYYDCATGTSYRVESVEIDMAHAWSDVDPKDR
jgi:hypothetical protein